MYGVNSSQSGDGLISHERSIHGELEIQGVPLEIVVVLNVNCSVKDWLPNVHEHEHGHHWDHESHPVLGEADVHHTVPLEGSKWTPVSLVRWFSSEGNLLFSQALDVLVDSALELGLHLVSLDHLNDLLLLLIN